ncbi:hypothetical protein [Terasakiispira papahanaumokuakeensis]|uniref:hypothetical protein n=1 Tax=Terasakiispira papahanaumokuakeensis TaxID=197479 RepID=UPI0011125CD6|nr:hypothetical protein [Terasakiispira papahanaumokuakeensis]
MQSISKGLRLQLILIIDDHHRRLVVVMLESSHHRLLRLQARPHHRSRGFLQPERSALRLAKAEA